ncbi:winged helix DNA-binding protein [Telmatospirillum sp.]|uniref:MarR family winged helix-turn-helix transcriptional regulator n=1 Tax=Telmatospirillum sp. TaxID=2079197 RepID=UPI00284D6331|nr:winged helix DNA-binding protein [Telmatospirillum sp.]MDR3437975.1 winged helix DNA-binding protein [Telmatospirillum sp.]
MRISVYDHIIHLVNEPYFNIVRLIERLHRHFLDVLRTELRRMDVDDINAVQALLLYNIGEAEVVVRDLKDRGYYHGSNVSYNIKKLTEFEYLEQERCSHDRRSIRLKLTEKGMRLCTGIRELQNRLADKIVATPDNRKGLEAATQSMLQVERTWTEFIRYGRE